MAGLLSGLGDLGLGNLEDMNLFEEAESEKKAAEEVAPKVPVVQETDFLYDKTYECPVCGKEFKNKTVKVGKAKLSGTDMDLRPKYEQIDLLKYDVIMCPHCGYAALSRYFKFITETQGKMVKKTISERFKPKNLNKDIYEYEDALERYKMALANAIVKQAKPSEKAYICLKTAWLLRGKAEHLDAKAADYAQKKKECEAEENEFLKKALEGFLSARQTESFPMCGMDESTVDYLIAVMAVKFGQLEIATKLVAQILSSSTTNPRMKDRARDLKNKIIEVVKAKTGKK
ncbi:MAG: DUF2225 domain-containing protein [Lachnospiraceae bacterium]|nr:DUF2225 domain-containing protein [Lachnospiraceae bacterium]